MAINPGDDIDAADVGAVAFNIETTSSTTTVTHSLTTIAGQRVVVFAKGKKTSGVAGDITLLYDGVVKDTISSADSGPFALMYTEVPGAGTKNITISNGGSNEVILVFKSVL